MKFCTEIAGFVAFAHKKHYSEDYGPPSPLAEDIQFPNEMFSP